MDRSKFEELIKFYIKRSERSQAATARVLGYHPSTLSKWLQGVNKMPFDVMISLSELFSLSTDEKKEVFNLAGYPIQEDQKNTKVPFQTLPRSEYFVNREKELKDLVEQLGVGKVVAVCGPGGIGKSSLVAQALFCLEQKRDIMQRFPDGVIVHNFYNYPERDLALEHIVRSYGEEPKPNALIAAQRILSQKQALLVFDGTERSDDLATLLNIRGKCGVVLTSRLQSDALNIRIPIKTLQENYAKELFLLWSKDRSSADNIIENICNIIGGMPLALRLAGQYVESRMMNIETYFKWLKASPLMALDHGLTSKKSILMLIEKTFSELEEIEIKILGVLGVLALNSFTGEILNNILPEHTLLEIELSLGRMVNVGLVNRDGANYQISHPLIHTFSNQRLRVAENNISNIYIYFNHLLDDKESYKDYDFIQSHITSFLRWAISNQYKLNQVVSLVVKFDQFLKTRGYLKERILLNEMTLPIAQNLGFTNNVGEILANLGQTYEYLGQFDKAKRLLEDAIEATSNNETLQCKFLRFLGNIFRTEGSIDIAIDYYHQSLKLARLLADPKEESQTLNSLATSFMVKGWYDKAVNIYQEAMNLSKELDDHRKVAIITGNIGLLYQKMEIYDQALEYMKKALEAYKEIGYKRAEAAQYGNMGTVFFHIGQYDDAIDMYSRGIEIVNGIGDHRSEGIWTGNLGNAYFFRGQKSKGVVLIKRGLSIAIETNDKESQANRLSQLGKAYLELGQLDYAKINLIKSIQLFQEINVTEAEKLRNILENI